MAGFALTEDERKFLEVSRDLPHFLEHSTRHFKSVQKAVSRGNHSTLIYPASGSDILRVVFGYDVDKGLFVDSQDFFRHDPKARMPHLETLETVLKKMNVPYKATSKGEVFEVETDLNGKTRQIIGLRRNLNLSGENLGKELENLVREFFGDEKVDILYTYWGFIRQRSLLPEMYSLIRQGGFYVTEEYKFLMPRRAERVLSGLLHLHPRMIVPRGGPNSVIYQKTGEAQELVPKYLLGLAFGNEDIILRMSYLVGWRNMHEKGTLLNGTLRNNQCQQQWMQEVGYPVNTLQDPAYGHFLSHLVHQGLGNIEFNTANLLLLGVDPTKVDIVHRSASLELRKVERGQYK